MNASRPMMALIAALALLAAAGADIPTLKDAEAEADRLDPGWRLADLQAKRPRLPADRDGAARVLAVYRSMTEEWKDIGRSDRGPDTPAGAFDALMKLISDDPTKPVPPQIVAALKAQQAKAGPLLAKARDLEKVATGRYEVTYARNPLLTLLPHAQDARTVARLLWFDALTRAAAGDVDGALASARAILGVARSIGDEPLAISQLVRMAIDCVAVDVIQRSLARGQATDTALAATQAALAAEAAEPWVVHAIRGERAMAYDGMGKIADGSAKITDLAAAGFTLPPGLEKSIPDARGDRAIALHLFNQAVEIARKPTPDQPALWDRWEAEMKAVPSAERDRHALAYLPMPMTVSVSQSHMRTRALLRTTETMVGLERVRRAKGRWPRPGDSLAPAFKDAPPADPFTGRPMLWKVTQTGLAVYSVGYDRADSGGKLEIKNVKLPGTDIGYILWDVDRRPRPARSR